MDTKKSNWKVERVSMFLSHYLKTTGHRCPLGYGAMMGMMSNLWAERHGFLDESTGVIEFDIPDIETWEQQIRGFFADKWAREKMNFHFAHFIKNYGKFKSHGIAPTTTDNNEEKLRIWKEKMGRKDDEF